MGVAVVLNAGVGGNGFDAGFVGHGEAHRRLRLSGRLLAVLLLIQGMNAAQQVAQYFLVRGGHIFGGFDFRQRLADHLAPALAGKHLLANRLHDGAAQNPLDHSGFHGMRRVVEYAKLRLGGAAVEEGASGVDAKALGNHNRHHGLALAHGHLRGFQGGWLHPEVLVGGQAGDDGSGNVALVLVDDEHRHAADFRVALSSAKQVAEEGTADDRHQQADDNRAPIGEKQPKIFSHQGPEGSVHESRRLLPVRVRKTDSRLGLSLPRCW